MSPRHAQQVREQRELDAIHRAVTMLEAALKGFPNLQHVRIDCLPDIVTRDDELWMTSWGSKTIVDDAGQGPYWPWRGTRYALVDTCKYSGHELSRHIHYAKVFAALNSIKDREWTLEISLYPMGVRECTNAGGPFDLSDSDWDAVRDRMLSVSLSQTLVDFKRTWTMQFLWSVSKNLRALTLDQETAASCDCLLQHVRLPSLTHLVVRRTHVATPLFNKFLYDHGEKLQSLICECATLDPVEGDESDEDDDADDSDEGEMSGRDEEPQIKKRKTVAVQYVKPKDHTRFSIFEQLLTFPNLQEVRFSDLRQDKTPWKLALCHEDDTASLGIVGGLSMAAEEECITLILVQVVKERATVVMSGDKRREKVWFPKVIFRSLL
jgi:hypothetical protein